MKTIKESLNSIQKISDYISYKETVQIDEGLKEVFNVIKNKFSKVYTYFKSIVVKVGAYILPVSDKGFIIPSISPLTAGSAYANGYINKASTFVYMDKEGAKITGCKTKPEDALKLYGSGNSISYWERMIRECEENSNEANKIFESYAKEHSNDCMSQELINEVKLHTEDPEAAYNIIVDDKELKDMITRCINNKKLARLLIWGAPGIGKTAILLNIIKEIKIPDYRLIVKTLSNETPDNFTLPDYVEDMQDDDFAKVAKDLEREESIIRKLYKYIGGRKAVDVPKTWLPVYKPTGDKEIDAYLDEKCGNGLLFVDELSRATPQVLNVMLPLINEGNFNGYQLGSGWTIICASNRMQDETSGQSEIGNALANRFLQVHYEPTVHTWRQWADKQNFISPLLLQWLSMPEREEMSGGKFYYMDPNEDSGRLADSTLICTPRAWTNAMRLLATYHHTGTIEGFKIFDLPHNIIKSALNTSIPKQAIDSFMSFLAVVEKIGNFDQAVYDVWQNGGKNLKIDKKHLTKVALPLAQLICCAHSEELPTKKEWENLCSWLVAQKSDQLASYVLDIFQNVFIDKVDPQLRVQLFYMQERIRRAGGDLTKLNSFINAFSMFCSKWHIDFIDIPDYKDGMMMLVKAYGASFESAVIDAHKSALG
jgi:MoxR-like ATPase